MATRAALRGDAPRAKAAGGGAAPMALPPEWRGMCIAVGADVGARETDLKCCNIVLPRSFEAYKM